MRFFCFSLFGFLLIAGCGPSSSEPSSGDVKDVKAVVKKLTDFYADKKSKVLKEIFADEPEPVVFGMFGEVWKGKETIIKKMEKAVEKVEDSNLEARDQVIKIIGNVAWFSQRGDWAYDYDGQRQNTEGVRLTGVLLKQGDNWKLVQWHTSYPVRTGGEHGQQNQQQSQQNLLYQQQLQQQFQQGQQQIQQQYDQQNEQWRRDHQR